MHKIIVFLYAIIKFGPKCLSELVFVWLTVRRYVADNGAILETTSYDSSDWVINSDYKCQD